MYPGQRLNAYSHLAGFVLAIGAGVLLLRDVLPRGNLWHGAAAAIFALSVIVLYAASTATHSVRGQTYAFWQRVDHCAVYLLIAATYTPFALCGPLDAWGAALLIGIWALFGLGVVLEVRSASAAQPSVRLYVAMGWLCVAGAMWGSRQLPDAAVVLLLAGAGCYTIGTVFYCNRWGLRHAHGIWHLFVLAGTTAHYLAIGLYVF